MSNNVSGPSTRWVEWVIRRNPVYLLSAALIATGARLFLVGPGDPAGDIELILLTLFILQVYEWTVGGILLALHRAKRSPEDKPSLLLVSVLFWTGPLAATIEMIAVNPHVGVCLAVGACVIAVAELRLVCKIMGLRLTGAGQAVGMACVMLLAAAAPLLKIPATASGTNELFLYGTWWSFAAIVLICLWAVRAWRQRSSSAGALGASAGCGQELVFLALTVAATAVHLIGMNYGFFCHAALFYSSPLIIAASVVGMESLHLLAEPRRWLLAVIGALPAVAILLALQPFHPEVPVALLPRGFHDPMLSISLIASAAWWFGYSRHRALALLHAGTVSLGVALSRLVQDSTASTPSEGFWIPALYVMVGYLVFMAWLHRSRVEAIAAVSVNMAATFLLVWDQTPADEFILSLVVGWSVLIILHLASRRPNLALRLVPILFLAIAPWICDSAPSLRWPAAIHASAMICVLFVAGRIWPWTKYRSVAILLVAAHFVVLAARWAMRGAHPVATLLVGGGFFLLAGGAIISWYKGRLLESIHLQRSDGIADQAGM